MKLFFSWRVAKDQREQRAQITTQKLNKPKTDWKYQYDIRKYNPQNQSIFRAQQFFCFGFST